jgi:hypothetical protein
MNLCFQVIYHISNGAILWKPDAMNNNLGEKMSYEDIYKILEAVQDMGLAAKQTSSYVGWWNATFRVFRNCNSGSGISNTS